VNIKASFSIEDTCRECPYYFQRRTDAGPLVVRCLQLKIDLNPNLIDTKQCSEKEKNFLKPIDFIGGNFGNAE